MDVTLAAFQQSVPIKTKLYARSVGGFHTDFSFTLYSDRVLLIVTQLGSTGTILATSTDAAFGAAPTYAVSVLSGKRDEPLLQLCAR